MDPWALVGILVSATVLLGAVYGVLRSLVGLATRGKEERIAGLEEQLAATRLALAAELQASRERAEGARSDWAADRELREAAADPDPARKHERLRKLLEEAQAGASPAGEQTDPDDGDGTEGA